MFTGIPHAGYFSESLFTRYVNVPVCGNGRMLFVPGAINDNEHEEDLVSVRMNAENTTFEIFRFCLQYDETIVDGKRRVKNRSSSFFL